MRNIFNNQYIGWIIFVMVLSGYSAYYYKTRVLFLQLFDNTPILANDFNTVLYDKNNKARNIKYIAREYHKLFKDTDLEHMPKFEFLDTNNLNIIQSISTNTDPTLVGGVNIDENTIVLNYFISFIIDSTNSVEDMVTNLKPGFEVLEKVYPKDRELLDKIYSEIPMHFTKYTNQENYQEKESTNMYISVSEEKYINVNVLQIYIARDEYVIVIGKGIHKEEK